MKLILTIQNQDNLILEIKQQDKKVIDRESLTISHNLDTLLITSIDKLLIRNRIDRLSLKGLEIREKLQDTAVSGMILKTVNIAMGFKSPY